ncbi:MAG: DUF2279 domain-containing protein [Candidatus Moranbacteria bacterium]|nr:DUF2279 domain-containing protein [Candidatus Moranbacteria bacterium]
MMKLPFFNPRKTIYILPFFVVIFFLASGLHAENLIVNENTNPTELGKEEAEISQSNKSQNHNLSFNYRPLEVLKQDFAKTDNNKSLLGNNVYGFTYPESLVKGRAIGAYTGLGVYGIGSVFVYNYIWYKDMERAPFHFYDDNKDWLQMDKHGHMYSAYHQTRMSYHLFRWIGYSKKTSLWISSGISTFIQFQVEFWDGLHEGYGFSYGDIIANSLGTGLFAAQEALWDEQIFKLKFSYWPSRYREHSPEHLGDTPFKALFYDYNAHTQWISGSLRRITGIEAIPKWLNISVGFSGMGMLKEIDNIGISGFEDYQRYSQTFLSLDVDLSYLKPKNPFLRGLVFIANMIKFPAPALEYNKVDGLKFRALYF